MVLSFKRTTEKLEERIHTDRNRASILKEHWETRHIRNIPIVPARWQCDACAHEALNIYR